MNRLMLCQGSQEALCSGAARAARRGSWQQQGTISTGYQVLGCPQRRESGAAVRYTKARSMGCVCV